MLTSPRRKRRKKKRHLKALILAQNKFTKLTDGITPMEARTRKLPFSPNTLYVWCLIGSPCPFLGRILHHEYKRNQTGKLVLYISEADLREILDIIKSPLNRPLPGNDGVWITADIYQNDQGLWYTIRYLEQYKDIVSRPMWYYWASTPAPDLDPAINEGRLRCIDDVFWPCFQVRKHRSAHVWVFFQKDVNEILERRKTPSRETPPGKTGKWIADDIYQDHMGLWYMRERAAAIYHVVPSTIDGWAEKPQPALDPKIHDGIVRTQEIPPRSGRGFVTVHFQGDLDKVNDYRKPKDGRQSEQLQGDLQLTLAKKLKLKTLKQRLALSAVLKAFREEVPTGFQERVAWREDRKSAIKESRYDTDGFLRWLDRRDILQLARQLKKKPTLKKWRVRQMMSLLLKWVAPGDDVAIKEAMEKGREAGFPPHYVRAAAKELQFEEIHDSIWELSPEADEQPATARREVALLLSLLANGKRMRLTMIKHLAKEAGIGDRVIYTTQARSMIVSEQVHFWKRPHSVVSPKIGNGNGQQMELKGTKLRIVALLDAGPLQGKIIAKRLGKSYEYTRRLLSELVADGELANDYRGYRKSQM